MKSTIKLCFFLSSLVLFQACTTIGRNTPTDLYHSVQSREDVATIANLYGCRDYQELAAINNIQPPYFVYPGQTIRIPANLCGIGTEPEYHPGSQPSADYYIAVKGDTLYDIARTYNISLNDIATWNNLQPPFTLSIGQQLKITSPKGTGWNIATQPRLKSIKPRYKKSAANYHRVVKGETLYRISKKYGYSILTIANWNNISMPYILSIGQKLRVSPLNNNTTNYNTGTSGYNQKGLNPNYATNHIVRTGETLQNIAKKYNLTVKKLSAWNGIGGPYYIYPDQRLRLTPP